MSDPRPRSLRAAVSVSVMLAALPAAAGQVEGRVRYLAPSAFPTLPPVLSADLDRRGCRIPQTPTDSLPHNVVTARLYGDDGADWAALCSIADTSRILVYRGGDPDRVDALNAVPDANFVQHVGGGVWEYSRFIEAIGREALRDWPLHDVPEFWPPAYSGLMDGFLDKGGELLVWRGAWLRFPGL